MLVGKMVLDVLYLGKDEGDMEEKHLGLTKTLGFFLLEIYMSKRVDSPLVLLLFFFSPVQTYVCGRIFSVYF